jgi:deoxyribodipyrimidine photo-lyase
MKNSISIIRFKKDLRIQDHRPLYEAIQSWVPCIAIFCFEPSIMKQWDFSWFHKQALQESLIELKTNLQSIWITLLVFREEIINILQLFNKYLTVKSICAHEETWNIATYKRDIHVLKRCKENCIPIQEFPTNGIVRWLKNRDQRHWIWMYRMSKKLLHVEPWNHNPLDIVIPPEILKKTMTLSSHRIYPHIQPTWESRWHQLLTSFLDTRYNSYLYDIWKPYESMKSCSRLSVHLTYGNMSIRQVYHASQEKKNELTRMKNEYQIWSPQYSALTSMLKHLNSFISRLHRHDHFIQKFESEVAYETRNIHPFYDRIRNTANNERLERFKAWMTWFPLIDAAVRCMKVTGWINFRLRATLVSFICNTCLQDRKEIVHFFSIYWTDYEPWIHYSQFQMQSWTTGINQYRIYNPTKQMIEKDSEWKFVDTWCPELKNIPMPLKAEPWKLAQWLFQWWFWIQLWTDYPTPLFDLDEQNRIARKILWDLKKEPWFRQIANQIYIKHGSRMRQNSRIQKK